MTAPAHRADRPGTLALNAEDDLAHSAAIVQPGRVLAAARSTERMTRALTV